MDLHKYFDMQTITRILRNILLSALPNILYLVFAVASIFAILKFNSKPNFDDNPLLGLTLFTYILVVTLSIPFSLFKVFYAVSPKLDKTSNIENWLEYLKKPSISLDQLSITKEDLHLSELLQLYQNELFVIFRGAESSKRRFIYFGTLFTCISLIVPITTWIIAYGQYLTETTTTKSLWTLAFSSTTAGAIGITIGVTLLRHGGKQGSLSDEFRSKYIHIERMKLSISASDINKKNKEDIKMAIIDFLLKEDPSKTLSETKDESNVEAVYKKILVRLLSNVASSNT